MLKVICFCIFLFVACVAAQDKCPNHPGYVPKATPLFFCDTWSNQVSCCNQTDDNLLSGRFNELGLIFKGNCQSNFKTLFCAWQCDPNQYTFVNATLNETSSITTLDIYWNIYTADELYESCQDQCSYGKTTWGQNYPNSTVFMAYFTSNHDVTYIPSPTQPITFFYVSPDPDGGKNITGLLPLDSVNSCASPTSAPTSAPTPTPAPSATSTSASTTSAPSSTGASLIPLFGAVSLLLFAFVI
eukprot:Phypoly_transcript_08595.p2 GENE.Phypoly_transcript_08595~~Phypoly_transcript_08595.p2  ORF type:complete len:243 (+),score=35.47 Phypoly_transcript_08595:753-1481(+)